MPVGVPAEVVALALFLCGIALVIVSVETFIESITESALELGVSGFFLTVVLAGADVENAIIGLAAVNEGLSGLALGTVFGEALFILAVAVGIAGVLTPFSTDVPRSYLLLVLGSPALLLVLALDGTLSQGDGAVLTVVFAPALGAVYLLERNRRTRYFAAEEVEEALEGQEGHEDQEEGPGRPERYERRGRRRR
jgi:cation:H+ antiporter